MAVKYQILFKDKRDNDCSVKFDFADYSGTDVISLTGAGTPITITYDGDQDDLFQAVITSKANVQVLVNQTTQQFVDDVRDIDDKQCFVTIAYGKNKRWIGNLIADQNYEKFDETGYFMSLTCVDPFSYLRENGRQILSTTNMYGFQTIYDFIQAVINESAPGVPVEIINDYTPSLKNCYFYTDTLMENGVYPDGYTMISKLMTNLCMTAVISNGSLYLINRRSQLDYVPKEVGIQPLGAADYLLANSEIITRTRGAKRVSTVYQYPNLINYIGNGSFYFYDPTQPEGQQITEWVYDPALLTDGGTITRVGNGSDELPYGVRFVGLWNIKDLSGQVPHNTAVLTTQYIYNTNNFDYNPSVTNVTSPFQGLSFDIDLAYIAYVNKNDNTKIQYGLRIFANVDGDSTTYKYDLQGSTGFWRTDPSWIQLPLNSTPQIQKKTIDIQCLLGSSGSGMLPLAWDKKDITITIELYGLVPGLQGDYVTEFPDNDVVYDITINKASIYQRNVNKISSDAPSEQIAIYSKDNTVITSRRNYSLIADEVDISFGEQFYLGSFLLKDTYSMRNENGVLMNTDNTPISRYSFNSDFTVDKLCTLIAKDRMFFGRQPRYKVDCEFESDDIDMSDTIKFTQGEDLLLPNTYTILSDELDVRMCRHHVMVQELTGSDDNTDTIQNYLGTD